MSKVKATLSVCVVVASFSAVASGPAFANWFVNGAELKSSAGVSTTAKVDEFVRFLVPALSDLTVECSGATFDATSPEIVGPGASGKAASVRFLSCNTTKPATGCALQEANQTISTLGVNVREFLTSGTTDGILFSPQTKKTFAEVAFNESNTCALAGLQPVKGAVTGTVPTGQTEEVAQSLMCLGSVENNSLEIGSGNKTYVTGGAALITLASGSKWSFK
jgi:hypothetical protein